MPLGQILPRPSLAWLDLGQRSVRGPQPGPARSAACRGVTRVCYGGDLTSAREAAGESTTGPHRHVDSGAADLVGVDSGAQAAWRFGGDLRGTTVERSARPRRRENAAARRTHRHVGWGRRRRGALGHAGGSARRESSGRAVGTAAREAKRSAARSGGGGCRDGRARYRQHF
jgi:hypothetical protein